MDEIKTMSEVKFMLINKTVNSVEGLNKSLGQLNQVEGQQRQILSYDNEEEKMPEIDDTKLDDSSRSSINPPSLRGLVSIKP